ncbi:alpha/beta hydrolase [Sphingobium xanthum]|uniref:alpha/beta hydrolase n=1 Tax=Sphingobium xanthum TaxID=1387165 RepID=UPI001C8C9404|nr:alpha/beta hydrolase [Sphingobium xanthum]
MSTISRHLVDPELLRVAELFPPQMLSDKTIEAARSVPLSLTQALSPGVTRTEHVVPGPNGAPARRLIVLTPDTVSGDTSCLFFIHGGGYVVGDPESVQSWASGLAKVSRCIVILPTYRLAPETRWPAPVDDLHAQYLWLHQNARMLGIDPQRVATGGASAGGGHAVRLALRVRETNGPRIHFQLLLGPMLDDRHPDNPYAGEYVWTRDYDRYGWDSLLGLASGGDGVPTEAVPNRIADLSGLPPTYIGIGDLDLFTHSCLDFAQRLMAGGVSTELHVYAGGFHGFEYFVPDAQISKRALDDVPRALTAAFARRA